MRHPDEEGTERSAVFLKHQRRAEVATMKLSYRGVKYEATLPTVATTEGKKIGHYRGLSIREHVVKTH